MAKYFSTQMTGPLQVPSPKVSQGTSMPASSMPKGPSDEQIKREAVRTAKQGAYTKIPASTAESESGLTLNVPEGTEYNEATYYNNLEKLGYPDFAGEERKRNQDIQEKEIVTGNKKLEQQLWVTDVAMRQALAGDVKGATITANKYLPEGEKVVEIRPVDKENVFYKTEDDPKGQTINVNEWSKMQAEAKVRMEQWLPVKTTVIGDKLVATSTHALSGETKQVYTVDWNPAGAKGKQVQQSKELWDWYTGLQSTKSFSAIKEARYRAHAVAAERKAPGDLALMKTYARATEPEGRTITDSDFTQVERAREFAARMGISLETYKSLLNNGTLGEPDRQRLVDSIETMYQTKRAEQKEVTDRAFYARAKAEGLPESLITPVEQLYIEPKEFKKFTGDSAGKAGYPKAKEVVRKDPATGRDVVYDATTKKALRWADEK